MKPKTELKPAGAPEFFSPQVTEARRFYLDLNPDRRIRLTVVSGGGELCAPDYAIQRDSFPFWSIEFVARGQGTLRLGTDRHELKAGKVFSYGPGIPHSIATDLTRPMLKYFVDFSGTGARGLLREAGLRPGNVLDVFAPNEVQAVFDDLIFNGQRGTRHSPRICAAILEHLALKIAESSAPTEGAEPQALATFQRCRDHIQRHHQRLSTLRQISRECSINAAHLCRLFRRFDHQSPYHFLLRLKMNFAAGQLHLPGVLIKQVAERAGFNDPLSFSRCFKHVLGLSPKAFRDLRFSRKNTRQG